MDVAIGQPVVMNPYPAQAESITRALDSSKLSVRILFQSSCNSNQVTIKMPTSVTYVPGSVQTIGGTLAIIESDISNLRTPKFLIVNVPSPQEIIFTLEREAACGIESSGKDTIEVSGSCGSSQEFGDNVNTYNLFAPSISITSSPPINDGTIGILADRIAEVVNGGNGGADSIFFNITYNAGIENGRGNDSICVSGYWFTPYSSTSTLKKYVLYGDTIFNGKSILTNGESFIIKERVIIRDCDPKSSYAAAWGVNRNTICQWATVNTNITMDDGVPFFASLEGERVNYVDKCTDYDLKLGIVNDGLGNANSAAMYNIKAYQGFYEDAPYLNKIDTFIWKFTNSRVGGTTFSGMVMVDSILELDFKDFFPTTGPDPDGPGGLSDLDNDGFYDDLASGDTLFYTINVKMNCDLVCGKDKEYRGAGMRLEYNRMCGDFIYTDRVGNQDVLHINETYFGGSSYAQANISNLSPFSFILKEGHFMNYSIYTNTNTRYRWRLIMPTGFSVSGGGNPTYNGAPATYTQVGDTITILSPDSILGQASIDLIFTCGIGGPKTFYYTMEKINDITTSCECQSDLVCDSVEVFAFCPGPCAQGVSNRAPIVTRTPNSLGWTDQTLTTRQLASNISTYDLSKAIYLDTIELKGIGVQRGTGSNLHLDFNLPKTDNGVNKLQGLNARVEVYRSGALVSFANINTFTDISSATMQTFSWDLSTGIPGGGLQNGDSIISYTYYVVAINKGLPQKDVQSGDRYFHYNLIAGIKVRCHTPIAELYLVGTHAVDERKPFHTTSCEPTSLGMIDTVVAGSNIGRRFAANGQLYENEFRPTMYIDSVVVTYPDLFVVNMARFNHATSDSSTVMTPNSINGLVYTYINPGTWEPLDLVRERSHGGNIEYFIQPTCSTERIKPHNVKIYYKDFYYAHVGKPTYPAMHEYILGVGGDSSVIDQPAGYTDSVTYSEYQKPELVIQNLTGEVLGVQQQQFWDVRISNVGIATAGNTWLMVESLTGGISIDSAVRLKTNQTLTKNTINANDVWFQVTDTGITRGTNEKVRVYFKYSNCTLDSARFSTGWDCAGFPAPDPKTGNICFAKTTLGTVVPERSQIQLTVTRQPGGADSATLCEQDSVIVQVNSAQTAYLVDPEVDIYPPTGVSFIVPVAQVEYPLGSGVYENVTISNLPGGGIRVFLNTHSMIGSAGIPGTIDTRDDTLRQAKIRLDFNTGCTHTAGGSINFKIAGASPCGSRATGDQTIVRTDGIVLKGTVDTGFINIGNFAVIDTFRCGDNQTIRLSAVPLVIPFQTTDTIIYTLPEGIKYMGNFTNITNCAACQITAEPGFAGSTILKMKMDTTAPVNSSVVYSFDVQAAASGYCGNIDFLGEAKRKVKALNCGGSLCPESFAFIGKMEVPIVIVRPDLYIDQIQGEYLVDSADHTYSFDITFLNGPDGEKIKSTDTIVVNFYLDNNQNNTPDSADLYMGQLRGSTVIAPGGNGTISGQIFSPVEPDSTKAVYAIFDTDVIPNCNCAKTLVSPMFTGLPVDLLSFEGIYINQEGHLFWTTASEENTKEFEVYRRIEGESFFTLVGNKAAAGNSNAIVNYTHVDPLPNLFGKKVYYRIKMIDFDNQYEYSKTIVLETSASKASNNIVVFPNPANDNLTINVIGLNKEIKYNIVNAIGQIMLSGNTPNNEKIDINSLAKGMYFVNVIVNNELIKTKSIIVD